ncbi:MAG: LysM peptidoglycan-binding domain-containing protein [Proteobacteria bacterium]|nr:LysM peptidoglycan-binding domain-containing protein [Pseudomonadota bacterium]
MRKLLSVLLIFIFVFSITSGKTHTVKKGDTLWDIAGYYLNNPFLWPEVYELNKDKIENPHWIYPGQVFELPIPGEDNTATQGENTNVAVPEKRIKNNFQKIKLTELNKRYRGKELSIAWLKAQKMIQKSDYLELFHIPNNVSYNGLYYGGFVTNKNIEKGRIIGIVGDKGMEEGAIKFDKVKIDLGKSKVKKGDKFTVFTYGKSVSNGAKAGRIINILGTLKVDETFDTYSVCTVTANREIIKSGLLVTNLWTPPFIPDFDFVKAKNKIYAKILAYRDNQDVVKDYNIAYVDKGKNEGFAQGDKFNIVDKKGNAHGEFQLLWVGDNFSSGYITRTGDMNLKNYKKIELAMKSLPKGEQQIIKKIPVKKVSKEEVIQEETPKVEEKTAPVINEEPQKPETTSVIEETPSKTTVEEQPVIVGDTVKSDSNATVIMERPVTTDTTAPVIEEQAPADTDTTTVIEEQTPADTTAPVIEGQAPTDTTTHVIEEQTPADTDTTTVIEEQTPADTTAPVIEEQTPADTDTTTVIEEGD